MKPLFWAAAGLLVAVTAVRADDKDKKPPSLAERMKAEQPGPAHKHLARLAGEYTTVTKFRPGGDAAPMSGRGKATITSVLGGRFIQEDAAGAIAILPMKAIRLIGFNNATGKYEAVWTYTGSTAIMSLTGTSDDGGKTIHFGAVANTKEGPMHLTVVMHETDEDHFAVELRTPAGDNGPVMHTSYTRVKKAAGPEGASPAGGSR